MKALVPTSQSRALVALADTGVPEPQPGEALVKVEAFSVNRGEIFQLEDPRPGTRPGKDIMIITDPAAAVTRYIDAVRDGDSSAIRECFAEDAIWDYPGDLPLSGTWRGRDSIVDDFLGTVGPALEPGSSVALEVTNVLSVGDQVVAEWTSRATARGGAAYHNRNVGIFTVRDGKITAVREYTDTQHAAHVLFGQP
jgi:ketosteroid isomerase-like protein